MNKNILFIALTALLVSGCAASVKVSTPRSVIIENVRSDMLLGNLDKALELAENECQKHDRHAVYIPDNMPDGNTNYKCVE